MDLKGKKVFLGPGYVTVLERGLYGLYRDAIVEEDGPDGKPVREKVGSIGPIRLLREAEDGDPKENVVLRTSHPLDATKVIELVETKG